MSPTRQHLRRAASVAVLVAGFVVLVATSPPEAYTSDRFEFEPVEFDGRSEVVEGSVGPIGELPPNWERQSVDVTAIADDPSATLYFEAYDERGRTLGSSLSVPRDVPSGALHEFSTGRNDCPRQCQGPVTYRVQRLDGGPVTVELHVVISLTEYDATDGPDVRMETTPPKAVPRAGRARASVLAEGALEAGPATPVSAAMVEWGSADCDERQNTNVFLRRMTPFGPGGRPRGLLMTHGDASTQLATVAGGRSLSPETGCERLEDGTVRHFTWVVLTSSAGEPVSAEVVVVGPAEHTSVRIRPVEIEATVVGKLPGAGYNRFPFDVEEAPSQDGTPVSARPPIAYFLAIGVPLPEGSVAEYQDGGPELESRYGTGSVGRVHLELRVGLEMATPESDPEDARAQVVLYRLWEPQR